MDAAKLRAALKEIAESVSYGKSVSDFPELLRGKPRVSYATLITLAEAAESQLKAMTGEG